MSPTLQKALRFTSYRLLAGFALVVMIISGLAVICSNLVRQLRAAEVQVARSLQILHLTADAREAALRVRLHVRGYVITGKETYVEEASQQVFQIQRILLQLHAEVGAHPSQRESIRQLEQTLLEGKDYLDWVIALRRTNREAAFEVVPGPKGNALAERMDQPLEAIVQTEQKQLEAALALARHSAEALEWLILASVGVIAALLVVAYFIVARELDKRRTLLSQLEYARDAALTLARRQSDFLANMSHEIRTPMNGIMGTSELLLRTPLAPNQKDLAETIRYSAESLLVIINDILDFSKIEAGKLAFESSDFDLRATVEQAVETVAATARKKSLELVTLVYRDVPEQLRGDAGRLRQVLLNLVGNAVKFTDRGEVVVRVTKQAETETHVTLKFSVTDTGIGIPKEFQEDIFEAFAQVDASRSRRFGGTGLGLAISKRLVQMMGGEIGVESEVGKGSTFWFTATLEKAEAGQPLSTYEMWFGLRALVVDDNTTNRTVLAQLLTDFGLFCEVVASPEEALAALREAVAQGDPFRVALLDAHLPAVDGLSLLQRIRAEKDFDTLACILLTPPPLPDPDELPRLGAAACLAKPVRMTALKEALRTALGKPRPRSPKTNSQETPRPTITTPTSVPRPDVTQPKGPLPPSGRPKTVLLVEDNAVNQQVACRMLEILGYQVGVAHNGLEAIERFQTQPPDAILMDCHLPEMDGYTATQRIREQERTLGRHVPIIALTANALAGERDRCLAAGMDDYLAKPFRMKDLEEVMQRVLGAASQPTPAAQSEHRTGEIPTENAESEAALLDADAFWIGTGITPGSHGAQQLAQQIITTFQSDVAAQMQELRAAMERQDAKEVRAIAHRLYGSAAQLGARRLARALKHLEKAPDASTWAAQLRVVEEVSAATSRAFDEGLQRKALVQPPQG
ncbi:response regulator [Chloracidobacterium thermophilum]|uniref:response regulator n=1 Tax=Chloracidobacterium thermophilum TaxID=458033 RepID=UPI0007385799|nr:response regulator [Chloracidobacterium thermophilum]